MEAKELRIGNYITDQFGEVCTVESINPQEIFNAEIGEIALYCVLPIPLSEEWLLKFGFEEHITLDIYPTYVKGIFNVNDNILYVSGLGFVNHIKHVHQLQNLYFALTGQELTLNQ